MSKLETDAIEPSTGTTLAIGAAGDTVNLSNATVNLPAAAVTTHVTQFDDKNLRNDIATLALHSAIADNKAAHNLSNAFIDQFEDDTGLDVETSTDRTTDEYISSISGYGGNDAYTVLLLHCNAGSTSSSFVDSSASPHTITASDHPSNPNQQGSGATIKFGASSGKWNNSTYLSAPDHADWFFDDGDWTMDFWLRHPQHCSTDHFDFIISQPNSTSPSGQSYFGLRRANNGNYYMMGNSVSSAGSNSSEFAITLDEWNHFAICQHGDVQYYYKDGVSTEGVGTGKTSSTAFQDLNVPLRIGFQQDGEYYNGWADEIRISKGVARYPSGTTFTPATQEYDELVVSATGNFTSATQTASASVSTMGIVVLYKNNAGTATLNSGGDLIASVSANGGTNYTDVTLVAGGTFSTGINIAAVSGVSVTAGTTPKYKISFANQAAGSKETQVHGVALLY